MATISPTRPSRRATMAITSPTRPSRRATMATTSPTRSSRRAATRKRVIVEESDEDSSATPQMPGTPLADITDVTINEQMPQTNTQKDIVPVKPMDLILEKPMDIVVRSRALAAPSAPESVGPRARTVIKYLVLTNFKSYAGRQEVGPFHASFSSVVGPNGSGKSNVIDSLLFVFGFRASKMRQGKISALIHNSTAFPNLDFCEVEVHFEEVMDLVRCSNPTSLHHANVPLAKRNAGNNLRLDNDYFSKGLQEQC